MRRLRIFHLLQGDDTHIQLLDPSRERGVIGTAPTHAALAPVSSRCSRFHAAIRSSPASPAGGASVRTSNASNEYPATRIVISFTGPPRTAPVKANDRGFLSNGQTVQTLLEGASHIHHGFPRNYLKKNGLERAATTKS